MNVLNLVFNRLGNNVSVLIDYPHVQVQLFDSIKFSVENSQVEISGFTLDTSPPFEVRLEIKRDNEDIKVALQFDENGLTVPDVGFFTPVSEGFSGSPENPEIIFRLGMKTDLIRDGRIFLPQDNFFQKVSLLILNAV
ncbi:hypothetical protein [Persephonella sp.]